MNGSANLSNVIVAAAFKLIEHLCISTWTVSPVISFTNYWIYYSYTLSGILKSTN